MFLTVCMILTSFQGVAFADLDSTAEDRDILIELDGAALKAEAEQPSVQVNSIMHS